MVISRPLGTLNSSSILCYKKAQLLFSSWSSLELHVRGQVWQTLKVPWQGKASGTLCQKPPRRGATALSCSA